jgi:hypothetical protein
MDQTQSPGQIAGNRDYSLLPDLPDISSRQPQKGPVTEGIYRSVLEDSCNESPLGQESHLTGLKNALMDLTGEEIARLLLQDDLLQLVMPVVEAVSNVRSKGKSIERPHDEAGGSSEARVHIGDAPFPRRTDTVGRTTSIETPEGGRLPPLAFSKYTLGDDILTYIRNFEAISRACRATETYMVNQLKCQLMGDAKDLLEAQLPEGPCTWDIVKGLATSFFTFADEQQEAWDYLHMAKFNWGDNLDLHFSKIVKAAKKATNDTCVFIRNTARAHFIRSLPAELIREAGLRIFASDDEMLVHLKKCVRFSSKNPSNNIRIPKNMAHLCSSMETLPAMETSTEQEELEVVTLALQAYGWQRSTGGGGDKSKPFQKFPCSLQPIRSQHHAM